MSYMLNEEFNYLTTKNYSNLAYACFLVVFIWVY